MSKILSFNGHVLSKSSRGLTYEPPANPFDTFFFLTYFQRANSISSSPNTNVRYYEKGEAKEAAYTDNPTRFLQGDMNNTSFGSFKCSYATSYYAPSNWTTYQIGVPFTQDMANAMTIGSGLQMEYIFRLQYEALSVPSTNYGRYVSAPNIDDRSYGFARSYTIPRQLCFGGGYGLSSDRGALDGGSDRFISDYSSLTNGFTRSNGGGYPEREKTRIPLNSTLGTTAHHMCLTLSKKNSKLRIWLDGILSGDLTVDMSEDSNEYINSVVGNLYHGWQICNIGNIEITQLGYREAVWTEAINYTPPTEAYLAVEDYF